MAPKKHSDLIENHLHCYNGANGANGVNLTKFVPLFLLFLYSFVSFFSRLQSHDFFILGLAFLLLFIIAKGRIQLGPPLAIIFISIFCFCPLIYQLIGGNFENKTLFTGLFFLSIYVTLSSLFKNVNDKTVVWAFFYSAILFYSAAYFYHSSDFVNFVALSIVLIFLNSKISILLAACMVGFALTLDDTPKAEIMLLCVGLLAVKFHNTFKKRLWKITYLLSFPVVTVTVMLAERNISRTEAVFSGRASIWSFWTEQVFQKSPIFGLGPRSSELHGDVMSLALQYAETNSGALYSSHSVLIDSLTYGGVFGVIVLYVSLVILISNRGTTLATFLFYFCCGAIHINSASPLFGTSPLTILFITSLVLQQRNSPQQNS